MKKFLCFALALGINLPLWAPAVMPVSQASDAGKADERFRGMDADARGFVTFEDFRKRYPNMGRPAFDAIDADKNGNINLEEWRAFFQSHGSAGAMPPGAGGQTPPPGHGGGRSGKPLILPPAR